MFNARSDEAASSTVESVDFSFMTEDDIRKISVKRITKPELFDMKGSPVMDGLVDPAMGPMNDIESCKSCGQLSLHCPGHCGHIDFALPIYNPLLFSTLLSLLQNICFFCHRFRIKRQKLQMYTSQLDLIIKGDVASARSMIRENSKADAKGDNCDVLHTDYDANVDDDSIMEDPGKHDDVHNQPCSAPLNFEKHTWTSLQHTEALSILLKFMREKNKKCQNCGRSNPKVWSPVFGMINMAIQDSSLRSNVISGSNHDLMLVDEDELRSSANEMEIPASASEDRNSFSKRNLMKMPSEFVKQKRMFSGQLLPPKVKYHLEEVWQREARFCSLLCDVQQKRLDFSMNRNSYNIFLMEALLVPPNKFRPTSKGSTGRVLEHPQNALLLKVLEANNAVINSDKTLRLERWTDLQKAVSILFDSSRGFGIEKETTGIRQLLEKKSGILRQKMMGKRVNFACRSVISPDPYLAVNEIGIPPQFAVKLTYPERVTHWNVSKLRQSILNGAEFHPGATHYKDKERLSTLNVPRNIRASISRKLPTSRGSLGQMRNGPESEFEGKVVYRHMKDGDSVLANRQPTLHKISMMALTARILKGEKTLRMHYANCSSFNADFDGDEMNVHLPQDEVSRAEAISIVNANRQYVLPASGKPVRGLIQDHIVSAVLLTKKDTFLTREEYHQLLYYASIPHIIPGASLQTSEKVLEIHSEYAIQPLPPALLKPVPLWSGKQVITAILNHITKSRQPLSVKKAGKITQGYLEKQGRDFSNCKTNKGKRTKGFDHDEFEMVVYKNEMLYGMIDKEQFGLYGLVHTVHELYGPDSAGTLLSMFSRLFTVFLQMHGFTCGVDDLLIVPSSEVERMKLLDSCQRKSEETHSFFVDAVSNDIDPMELQVKVEEVLRSNGEAAAACLDRNMSSALNQITSSINENLVPGGLLKPFSKNCVSLMTATGAKGSSVNFNQISSLLGQQELEGKRVPRMVSGKTLPSFPPWDIAPRAGGFISDRFLTGLRPQEYYFHCMAGREGLVDTAIKTSRSGYLQRCLMKNLESLKVCYDHTVRDVDGSVVQFIYGEDGVDVHRTSFLHQFEAHASNHEVILEGLNEEDDISLAKPNYYLEEIPPGLKNKAESFLNKLSGKQRELLKLRKAENLMKLIKIKYRESLVPPGEAVGVLASQSLGEQTTQMTLNTFHLAGRGDVNVTLGIPRLQEILMFAKDKIRTPVMTCPLREGMTKHDADSLAGKLRRITIADIVERMEVCVVPFCISKHQVATMFKLKMMLYPPELYPSCSDITLESCQDALLENFVPALDLAIKRHMGTLSKIAGTKFVSKKEEGDFMEGKDEEETDDKDGDNDGNSDEDDVTEDQGADAEKRKMQTCDEMEYDDDDDDDDVETDGDLQSGFESEVTEVNDVEDDGDLMDDAQIEDPESLSKRDPVVEDDTNGKQGKTDARKKSALLKLKKRKLERVVNVETKGLEFQIHLSFKDEPHILLAEIAQRTAKSVFVKKSSSIEQCSVIKEVKEGKESYKLQTAGVDFPTFWNLENYLDITQISSNNIHAILETYGVEAARATIIQEVNNVFKAYGISVDIRHLTLLADFMTFNGDYRPMNRNAMTSYSTSPFGKITFETATKFIVEAALHGEVDRLESPSGSICLGQPVKLGTGCFDLLQNLQV